MMPRFSLKQLLILVAFASVTCAALAQPGYWWHATIVTAVAVTAIGMLIVALVSHSQRRAFAVGWLLLAVGYQAIVLGPWTGTHLSPQLLSTRALARLEAKWHGEQQTPLLFQQTVYDYDGDGDLDLSLPYGYYNGQPAGGSGRALWAYTVRDLVISPPAPHPAAWPLSTNYTVFQGTAHWLIAAVLGYLGGMLAMVLARDRQGLSDGSRAARLMPRDAAC